MTSDHILTIRQGPILIAAVSGHGKNRAADVIAAEYAAASDAQLDAVIEPAMDGILYKLEEAFPAEERLAALLGRLAGGGE